MSKFCRDCAGARVIGSSLGEPVCRCSLGRWGPESWPCALVAPACGAFGPAAEQPADLAFWQLAADFGLEPAPKPRRKRAREMAATLLEAEGTGQSPGRELRTVAGNRARMRSAKALFSGGG